MRTPQSLSAYEPNGEFGCPFHRGHLEFTCAIDGQRGGLFDEHRNASLHKPSCDHCIKVIRQSHDGRVDTFAQRCESVSAAQDWK
jgi:hypothetical protein